MSAVEILLIGQASYFLLAGVWPLLHMRSFLAVTGPKADLWLVKTVGVLIAVIGAALLVAELTGYVTMETVVLAVGAALALAAVDIIYAAKKTIAKIYLLDAVLELVLVAAWFILLSY